MNVLGLASKCAMAAIGAALFIGCARLPALNDRSHSLTLQDTGNTKLGRSVLPLVQMHPGQSGVFALPAGRDAFAALRLARTRCA